MITDYRHVVWDWNGTLLDDVWLCLEIINGMLSQRHLPTINQRRYKEAFDFPVQDYYERLGFDFSAEPFSALSDEYCDVYATRVNECKLHQGALPVVTHLDRCHITQTILSAAKQSRLERMIDHFGLAGFFHRIVGQDNRLAMGKVDKGRRLLEGMNIRREATVLVGDTVHDAEVADALGIDCVLVRNGHHSESKLASTNAPVVDLLDLTLSK